VKGLQFPQVSVLVLNFRFPIISRKVFQNSGISNRCQAFFVYFAA
jgi:hypothetical protein